MLLYEDVCVFSEQLPFTNQDGREMHRNKLRIRSYTEDGKALRAEAYDLYQPNPGNYEIAMETVASPLEQWWEDSDQALEEEDTLFTLQLHHNPGHCLSDMVFSLALDRSVRGEDATSFPKYVYGAWQLMVTDYEPDWCFELLGLSGYIQPESGIVQRQSKTGASCFSKLYVPIFGLHRFPVDTADEKSVQAFRDVSVMKHFLTQDFTNPELEYPVNALETLRSSVCESLSVPCTSWGEGAPRLAAVDHSDVSILIYNREGSPRRHWQNAKDVKTLLEADYAAKVTIVGKQWETMSMSEQLGLYNSHSHIVTVHGAHEANLIVSRPNTKVVEIQCLNVNDPHADESLTQRDVEDPVAWYGPPSWFSIFSRRLGMDHFVYQETDGCAGGQQGIHGSSEINVDAARVVRFVAGRFSLQRRAREANSL
jgi:hypothetical protein